MSLPKLSRRKLLKVFTLLSALPMLGVGDAIAYVKGSASAANGGRSQINPNLMTGRAGEWPFINQFKTSPSWTRFDGSAGPIDPSPSGSNLDVNGYPQSTPSYGGSTLGPVVTSQNERPGNWCVLWDGTGTNHSSCGESGPLASCSFTGVIASNVLTASAVTGTIIPGQLVAGTGVGTYTIIIRQIAGTSGGAGTYQVSRNGTVNSTAMTASGGSLVSSGGVGAGFYSFSTNATTFQFAIGAVGSPYITNLRLYHIDDVVDGLAGKVFSAKFKERLRQGNWNTIRFLNWGGDSSGGINNSNQTTWATRKPINYVYFDGCEFRPSLYAGTASLSGTAYSCGAPAGGFSLVHGAQASFVVGGSYSATAISFTNGQANITMTAHGLTTNARLYLTDEGGTLPTNFATAVNYFVTVVNANTITLSLTQGGTAIVAGSAGSGTPYANPVLSLNVASTGAIPVLNYSALPMNHGNNTYPTAGTSGSYATATYDAVINSWLWYGGNAVFGAQGINNGCPPELRLQLCIEMGAHLWDVTPPFAADPLSDYMPSYMTMVHTGMPSWMIPIWEPPNENWNNAFLTNWLGLLHSAAYSYVPTNGDGSNAYYGKVASVLGQAAASEFGVGNKGVTYHVACGVQLAFGVATNVFNENMTSNAYVNQAQAPQSPYTKSAASGWVTFVSPSMYIVPTDYGTANETAEATAYNGILFTGYIAGSVLTVTVIDTQISTLLGSGNIANGQTLFGSNVPANITIASAGTGSGGTGTYNLSASIGNVGSASATQQFTLGTDLTQPGIYIATLTGVSSGQNLAAQAANYLGWKNWAAGFGVQRMRPYEGGLHDTYDAGGTSQRDLLRAAARRVAALQTYTTTNYTNMTGLTGGGFTAENPSCFQLGGKYPSNNSWSIIENVWNVGYQTPYPPPEFAAIIAFNH